MGRFRSEAEKEPLSRPYFYVRLAELPPFGGGRGERLEKEPLSRPYGTFTFGLPSSLPLGEGGGRGWRKNPSCVPTARFSMTIVQVEGNCIALSV